MLNVDQHNTNAKKQNIPMTAEVRQTDRHHLLLLLSLKEKKAEAVVCLLITIQ